MSQAILVRYATLHMPLMNSLCPILPSVLQSFWIVQRLDHPAFTVTFFFLQRWVSVIPTYISGGWLCESASVTWLKKAWMRACRSGHQANVSIREYKKGGEPSPRAHYRVVPIAPAHFVSLPPHVNSWQIFTTQSFQPNSPYLTREL